MAKLDEIMDEAVNQIAKHCKTKHLCLGNSFAFEFYICIKLVSSLAN